MSKRFILILLGCIIALGAIFIFTRPKASAPNSNSGSNGAQLSNHVMGSTKSGVKLVEWGDYQCPACGSYYPLVKQITDKYTDRIQFQFRNFPLVSLHPNALVGARAAEAAGLQNKYWEMHDQLYQNQQQWSAAADPTPYFDQYAQAVGLNVQKFNQDLKSSYTNDVVQADLAQANKNGFNSTPTFVLDGKQIEQNPRDFASFSKLIDDAIAQKNKTGS